MFSKKLIVFIFCLAAALLGLFFYNDYYQNRCYETRYAFDFGSGALKARAAIINICNKKIDKVLHTTQKNNSFEGCLVKDESGNNIIPEECIASSKDIFYQIEKEMGVSCKKDKCAGIATAWARHVQNTDQVLDVFNKLGANTRAISQEEEGILGYYSALAYIKDPGIKQENIVIWDIGGGSFQFSTLDENGRVYVYHGPYGVLNFEKQLRVKFNLDRSSHYPYFSGDMLKEVMEYAVHEVGAKLASDPVISKKLKNPMTRVYGIGSPFSKGLTEQMSFPAHVKIEKLKELIHIFEHKTQDDIHKRIFPLIPRQYISSPQISGILFYGIMLGANIKEINVLDAMITDYVLVSSELYNQAN